MKALLTISVHALLLLARCTTATYNGGKNARTSANNEVRSQASAANDSCGMVGFLTTPSYIPVADNQTVPLATCRDFCSDMNENKEHAQDSCQVFGYNSTSNLCIIYSQPIQYLGFRNDSKSDTAFYPESCLGPIQDCDVSPQVNLLNNPNFNISKTYIGPWYARGNVKITAINDNTNAAALKGTSKISQVRGLCDDTGYRLSVDYKTVASDSNPNTGMSLKISMGDCSTSFYTPNQNVAGKWQTIECSLGRTTSNSQYAMSDFVSLETYTANSTAVTYFSNPYVRRIPSYSQIKTTGLSLLQNGGFETGTYKPWKPKAPVAEVPVFTVTPPGLPAKEGTEASRFKFQFTGTGEPDSYPGETDAYFTMEQNLTSPTIKGSQYLFIMEYRAFQAHGFLVKIGQTTFDRLEGTFPYHESSNKTTVFSRIFTGSGNAESLYILFSTRRVVPPPVQLTVLLDNISIKKLL